MKAYLTRELFEVVSLLSERVCREALHEGDHAVREVMLRQPRHHFLLLHIRSGSDI